MAASLQFTMPRESITIQAVFEPDVSKTALEEAEHILAAEGVTLDEVDAAEEKLLHALDVLVRIGDKAELNVLIEKAEA